MEKNDAVCDAGPIIHLDQLGCLDVMEGFDSLRVTEIVWNEARKFRPALGLGLMVAGTQIVSTSKVEHAPADLSRIFNLHRGEVGALALAHSCGCKLLLTDDLAARRAARSLGLCIHGTVGLLVRAFRRGSRTLRQVRTLLNELPVRTSLHIDREILRGMLAALPAAE